MYMAKRDSKGSYRVFEPEMHREVVERLEMRADLQRALDGRPARGALPARHPALRRATVYGVEALLRWHHPTRGNIPPDAVHPARRGDRPDHPDRPAGC